MSYINGGGGGGGPVRIDNGDLGVDSLVFTFFLISS